jgi:hypothetical protein
MRVEDVCQMNKFLDAEVSRCCFRSKEWMRVFGPRPGSVSLGYVPMPAASRRSSRSWSNCPISGRRRPPSPTCSRDCPDCGLTIVPRQACRRPASVSSLPVARAVLLCSTVRPSPNSVDRGVCTTSLRLRITRIHAMQHLWQSRQEELRHRHGRCLVDLCRHRPVKPPGDRHRPIPFVRHVVGGSKKYVRRCA